MSLSDLRRSLAHYYDAAWAKAPAPRLGREGILVLLLVIAVWAAASLPISRPASFIYEEGRNAAMAKDIVQRGHWLEPEIYGERWAEKPILLPWTTVLIAPLTGGVNEWSARWPVMLSVLLTALLIQRADAPLCQPGRLALRHGKLSVLLAAAPETHHRRAGYRRDRPFLRRLLGLVGRRGEGARRASALDRLRPDRHLALFGQGAAARGLLRLRGRGLYPAAAALGADQACTHRGLAGAGHRLGGRRLSASGSIQLAPLHAHGRAGRRRQHLYERARFIIQLALEWLPDCCCPSWRPSAGGGAAPLLSLPVVLPPFRYAGTGMALLLVWPGTGSRYAMPLTPAVCVLGAFIAQSCGVGAIGWDISPRGCWARRALSAHPASIGVPVLADQFGLSRATGR